MIMYINVIIDSQFIPRSQFLILTSEQLKARPEEMLHKIFQFIGVQQSSSSEVFLCICIYIHIYAGIYIYIYIYIYIFIYICSFIYVLKRHYKKSCNLLVYNLRTLLRYKYIYLYMYVYACVHTYISIKACPEEMLQKILQFIGVQPQQSSDSQVYLHMFTHINIFVYLHIYIYVCICLYAFLCM
jgi:hypothetical protein